MRNIKLSVILFAVLFLSQCVSSTDYKSFIIGTWEGHSDVVKKGGGAMFVTFNKDNTVVLDYSPSGGEKINATYEFIGENRIRISQYSVVIFIRQVNNNELSFVPEGKRITENSDVIFLDSFKRVGS